MNRHTSLLVETRPSGTMVIHVTGDLDSMGTHEVEDTFKDAVSGITGELVVDLTQVGFISSAGMAMLLVRGKNLGQLGGRLSLAAPSTRVLEVLNLAGFHELFDVYDSVDAALGSTGEADD